MKLSAVITTKNEAANIENCIRAFDAFRDDVEIIVVDNGSTDDTKAIAERLGVKVFDCGPERCAQRNFGWRAARSEWVIVLDADMIVPRETIVEILEIATAGSSTDAPVAYWIGETRTGDGFRVKARNFERSFYDGTCIDALRLFRKSVLSAVGGYDEKLLAGGEDWELDIRILATGAKCALLHSRLVHNEKRLSFKRMLEKKAYYSRSIAAYRAKWPGHPAVKKQFSAYYRFFGVFVEQGKWRRLLRHPILFAAVLFERFAVGIVYLANKGQAKAVAADL